jgi:hypothetical protein
MISRLLLLLKRRHERRSSTPASSGAWTVGTSEVGGTDTIGG